MTAPLLPSVGAPGRAAASLDELPREECLALLAAHTFGRLAVTGARGVPVLRPLNYRFDEAAQAVHFWTPAGSKLQALRRAGRAAFEVDRIDERTGTGWSVIVTGVVEPVTAAAEQARCERWGRPAWAGGLEGRWMRMTAETVSGRRLEGGARVAG